MNLIVALAVVVAVLWLLGFLSQVPLLNLILIVAGVALMLNLMAGESQT